MYNGTEVKIRLELPDGRVFNSEGIIRTLVQVSTQLTPVEHEWLVTVSGDGKLEWVTDE